VTFYRETAKDNPLRSSVVMMLARAITVIKERVLEMRSRGEGW